MLTVTRLQLTVNGHDLRVVLTNLIIIIIAREIIWNCGYTGVCLGCHLALNLDSFLSLSKIFGETKVLDIGCGEKVVKN